MTPESEQYTKDICVTKDSYNCNDYRYDVNKDIAIDFKPPVDYHYQSNPNDEYAQLDEKIDRVYTNFSYTFSAYFINSVSNLRSITFQGFFAEQKTGVEFNLPDIKINFFPPSVTLTNFFKINKFTSTIYSQVTLER